MRYVAHGNVLSVDFPQATKSWKFRDITDQPMEIIAIHTLVIEGTEIFAVALQSSVTGLSEIRLLCASTSITAPVPLTVLIITFNDSTIVPTAFASADGGAVVPSLRGKTLLSVGLSNGEVHLFNLSMAFRLDVCRRNAQRTSSASAYTFENFQVKCGRKVAVSSSSSSLGKVCALGFVEMGGSFAEAAISVVRETQPNGDAELQVVYLDPQPDRAKQHGAPLPNTAGAVGWTLNHVHDGDKTLLTFVCSKIAYVFTTHAYTSTLWTTNSQELLLSNCHDYQLPEGFVYVGMELLAGKRALLISALHPHSKVFLRVKLIQLNTNKELYLDDMEYKQASMCTAAMAQNLASTCISCKMSYSVTQLESGCVDDGVVDKIVDHISTYVPCISDDSTGGGGGCQWTFLRSASDRGKAIKRMREISTNILQQLDMNDVRGLGLDIHMHRLRNNLREGSTHHRAIGMYQPRLQWMWRQMVEQRRGEAETPQLRAESDRTTKLLDALLDAAQTSTINAILGHCNGEVYSTIWMWSKELVVTYHQRLMWLLSDTDLGIPSAERPKRLHEASKMSNALSGILSVVNTARERLSSDFPPWTMKKEEYRNQMLEIEEICDLTSMLLSTAQVSTWFVEFLQNLKQGNSEGEEEINTQSYSERVHPWTTDRHERRQREAEDTADMAMGNVSEGANDSTTISGGGKTPPLLFCEELMNIVERACPGTRRLLSEGRDNTTRQSSSSSPSSKAMDEYESAGFFFPPQRCNTLLHMFMVGDEDVPAKTCLALYAALDVAAGTNRSRDIDLNVYMEEVASDFA